MNLGLPFEDALIDLRITGYQLLNETYASPWAIDIPGEAELRTLMKLDNGVRVVPFHLVRQGWFELLPDGQESFHVQTHDVAICPGGGKHRMQQGAANEVVPLSRILGGEKPLSHNAESTESTELICGVFLLRAAPLNPLLAALPSVIKVATADAAANPMLGRVAEMLALEIHRSGTMTGGFTAARLLEIFCAEILRALPGEVNAPETGWLRGLADAKIAKALSLIHAQPEAPWSVDLLADAVALSPSRFAARFRDTIGETAMAYVTRWRMVRACRLLENPNETIDRVATQVGYSAASSFSRAFKASVGVNPMEWRMGVSK